MDNKQKNTTNRNSIFDIISEKFFSLLKNGMFGYFFTSYDTINEKYLKAVKRKGSSATTSKAKRGISKAIENSFFVNAIPKLFDFLLRVSLRDYGIMLLVMGALTSLLYPLREQILLFDMTFELFITGIAICTCAIPLLFSSKSLASNLYNSKLCNKLLFDFLGFDKEKMREVSEKDKHSSASVSFFVGLLLGVLSFFVPPATILIIALLIIVGYSVLKTPEIGAVLIVFLLPIMNTVSLCISIAYVFVCYVIKCVIGKRTFKFEYFDIWVVVLGVFLLIRGLISSNVGMTFKESAIVVCLMLSYFIITNLIKTKEWFKRCGNAFVASGTIVAIIAIFQAIIGQISVYVPDLARIFTAGQSVTSVFGEPEVLAHFLVLLIPFIFVKMLSSKKGMEKFVGFIFFVVVFVAIILTHSISAITGAVSAILLLLVFYHRNYIYLTLILLIAVPVLCLTLPKDAMETILSLKTFENVTFAGEIEKIRHAFQLFLSKPLGIGAGENIFIKEFGGSQGYVECMPVQLLIEQGIIGIIVIAVFLVMFARLTFTYSDKSKNKYRKINGCAGFCSLIGLLNAGLISYTLYDKRMLLLVFVLIALTYAYMKIEREDEEPKSTIGDYTTSTLDILLTGENEHDNVPRRKYVRIPKQIIKEEEQMSEAKEFDELDEHLESNEEETEVVIKENVESEFEQE